MATRADRARPAEGEARRTRRVRDQPGLFLGLFLAPFAGLLSAWLIHYYLAGWTLGSWHVPGSRAAEGITTTLIGAFGVVLAFAAWHFAAHRKPALRIALTASVSALAVLFGANVGAGPHRWWGFADVACGWAVAVLWSLTRLNVTRADPRVADPDDGGILERWGLKGFRARKVEHVRDPQSGDVVRTEIDVQHAPGATIEPLQSAVPNMESYAAAPANLSRAVATDRADRSHVTLMRVDPLAGRIPYGPPSHPGGSIADGLNFALYDDGHPVWCHLGGGPGFDPSAYGFMGMTRTGKTLAEDLMLTEVESRTDAVILYLNRAKGMQDVRPVIPGVEAAVLSDHIAEYVSAMQRVKQIMSYRQRQLAAYGIPAWSASRCFHHPPRRKANGEAVPMEPMPALIVHFGEADDLLTDQAAGAELAVYLASKGLSLGVIPGFSLQRASAESMPTGLRYNVGSWWCFGTGDAVSAGFALSDATISAGAHPENWKQSKPGSHFYEGVGVDEALWAKRAKTYSLAPGLDGDEHHDVLNAGMQEEMLRRNLANAPRMARLDCGSANATASPGEPQTWWDRTATATATIRRNLLGGTANMTASPTANPPPGTASPTANRADPPTATWAPGGSDVTATLGTDVTATFTANPPADAETADRLAVEDEVTASIETTREIDGFPLYPHYEDGTSPEDVDLRDPLPEPPPDDDTTFEDPRPPALGPEDARRAFVAALGELIEAPDLRDPADPSGNTVIFGPSEIQRRYQFKSRPWFSAILSEYANGRLTEEPTLALSRAEDLGSGRYRLSRVPEGVEGTP